MLSEKSQWTQNGTMFVDLDWPLNASSPLSASAELLVLYNRKKKGRKEERHPTQWQTGYSPRPLTSSDKNQTLHGGWTVVCSYTCQVWSKSVKGLRRCEGSKWPFAITLASGLYISLYQRTRRDFMNCETERRENLTQRWEHKMQFPVQYGDVIADPIWRRDAIFKIVFGYISVPY